MLDGTKLGRYQIKEKIGAGGMGEVYLAADEDLSRDVAVKVLLPEFFSNPERVSRFKLEARAASALNHPNIITIYEIGQQDEQLFIATEWVKGETLRSLIERDAINFGSALHIAEQIAAGVTAAHNAGIVHRDLKPENIMVREDGLVKVLDFGLAKPTVKVESEAETREMAVNTKAGMVMGSVSYMSPEQARGKDVDTRSDLWSLGVILYEMVSGKTPFEGETMTDILANIIYKEPLPIAETVEDAPPELHRILKKSLRKDREERYQSAKDLLLDLKTLRRELELEHELEVSVSPERRSQIRSRSSSSGSNRTTGRNPLKSTGEAADTQIMTHHTATDLAAKNDTRPFGKKRSMLPVAAGALLFLAVLAAFSFYWWHRPPLSRSFFNPQISTISKIENTGDIKISPDGKYLVYVQSSAAKEPHLILRQIETGSEHEIAPIEKNQIGLLQFSPDGNYVYFTMQPKAALGFNLFRVPTLGGEVRQIAYDVDSGVSFRPDGKSLIFHRHVINPSADKLVEVNADGTGEKELLTSQKFFNNPQLSPDGKTIAVMAGDDHNKAPGKPSVYFATLSEKDGEIRQFGSYWGFAKEFSWLRDGSGLVVSGFYGDEEDSKVYLVDFPSGEVRRVTNDANSYYSASVTADSGTIVTIQSNLVAGIWEWEIGSGKARQISPNDKDRLGTEGLAVAPNGKIIYTKPISRDEAEIWEMDTINNVARPLTAKGGGRNQFPFVSADGNYIFYESFRANGGGYDIWRMNADGSNPQQITRTPEIVENINGISPDNKTLVYTEPAQPARNVPVITALDLETMQTTALFENEKQYPNAARLAPDGKNLLYVNAPILFENGVIPQSSLYIAPVEGKTLGQPKQILQTLSSNQYRWSADGKFLYYTDANNNSADIWKLNPADGKLAKVTNFNLEKIFRYAASPDGKKLYLVRGSASQEIVLIKSAKR